MTEHYNIQIYFMVQTTLPKRQAVVQPEPGGSPAATAALIPPGNVIV